ncbi:hypothetical protein CSUB8523_0253 [Campylobacter subantarcticus LMG 24377]|uniref:Uncharacterized protein n=1 Tax=Campylobacter subantarcticus TaxID=497724 RepID=A0ABW9N7B6_9BACT|nr:hypothetical protein [Campylobacter subantarcticus]AJC91822.1 hypothetical protein CSUB8523_0253 [Campylobacter subantarcticus LMG 24377]EAL3939271.1 hypothetical protein [Campylobacter lari]MPC00152.1 hypothetical protein [Campylobacter subantarcticus]
MFFDLQNFIILSQKITLNSHEKTLLLQIQNKFKENIHLLQESYDYSLIAYCVNVFLDQSLPKQACLKNKFILQA